MLISEAVVPLLKLDKKVNVYKANHDLMMHINCILKVVTFVQLHE